MIHRRSSTPFPAEDRRRFTRPHQGRRRNRMAMKTYLLAGLVVACSALSQGTLAQTSERQVIDDAAQALGGRDRVMGVNTLLIEGAGHEMNVGQSLRYDEL